MKKWKVICFTIFIIYLVFAQSCLKMRIKDSEAKNKFGTKGVNLIFKDYFKGDLKIHYAQTGIENGSTILFIHGSPGAWDAYKNYLMDSALLKKYRLISIDRTGFGHSNFNKPQTLKTQTTVLNSFINSIDNNKPIYLVGHSYGGPLVASLAVENKKINAILILAGAVSLDLENPEKWRKIFIKNPLQFIVPGALNPSNHELWWLKNDLIDLDKNLTKITCKTIAIHGDKDKLVNYGNLKFMKENITNADTLKAITLKDTDHFIPWTNFELVKKELLILE